MEYQENAKLLTAESNKYIIEGNDVISHRIRLNIGGEIYPCKSTPEQVADMKKFEGKDGVATVVLTSRKEALSLKLVDFKEEQEG